MRWLLVLLLVTGLAGADEYLRRDTQGFTVLIHDELLKSPLLKPACELLDARLRNVVEVVPAERLPSLRAVRFWMRLSRDNGAMAYHPSRRWLSEHGLNPEMARGIEISNTEHFVKWCSREQPMMVLHELAHAYCDQVLGNNWAPLEAAYGNAVKSGLYESVAYVLSKEKRRAYALTDQLEYFAELSEAYFGRNDFFPYTRSELQSHDPVGFQMIEQAWLAR